ncbi:MAG: 2TM domain-containing protein [Flavisolibacter sp.]
MLSANDSELRVLAHKRIEFRSHLIVYCVINATLWTIWYFTGKGYIWPIWPLAGWGIGLLFHYLFEYRPSRFLSEEEEFNKLKRRMESNKNVTL